MTHPARWSLLYALLLSVCTACTQPPEYDQVFKNASLYQESINLTLQMLASETIYDRLEQSLPNIKRAHGLEKEHCLILTGWSPMDKDLLNAPPQAIIHRLEHYKWHLHKKHPEKTITATLHSTPPRALIFSMQYADTDGEYMDMGIDIFTQDNYLFSVKIHGRAPVMLKEKKRFTRELEQIRHILGEQKEPFSSGT